MWPGLRQTVTMNVRRWQAWLFATGFWTLFGAISGMQIWISMIAHGHSMARVVFFQIVVWDLWILFSFAIVRLLRVLPLVPVRLRTLLMHVLVAAVFGTVHAALWVAVELLIVPYDWMNPRSFVGPFTDIAVCQMPLEMVLYALVVLAVYTADYYTKYQEKEVRAAQLERSLAEARLHALELQLQPHFLFNTLNAISALVRGGQVGPAVGMISGLSDLLRYALERAGDSRVALEDEAAMLQRYFEIQRLRFADRLTFEIDIAAAARRAAVPVLLLQPLAENAIRHGIARSEAPGRVGVRAFRLDGTLRIEMFNTGHLAANAVHGIGLANTLARLEQLHGTPPQFELIEHEGGVLVRLMIPWSEVP